VVVEGGGKGKKSKANTLTIHKVINMTKVEVNKLNLTKIKAINKLYSNIFMPLHKWGKKPLANANVNFCVYTTCSCTRLLLENLCIEGLRTFDLKELRPNSCRC